MYGDQPAFTSSIDAAMTLVPEGGEREILVRLEHIEKAVHDRRVGVPSAPLVHTIVYRFGSEDITQGVGGSYRRVPCFIKNKTHALAIALCIASLRAHEAMKEG